MLCSEQRKVSVYCCLVIPAQSRCIQCGVVWLHRIDVCVRVRICVLHAPQIHTRGGPGFLSTSPARSNRRARSILQTKPPMPEYPI